MGRRGQTNGGGMRFCPPVLPLSRAFEIMSSVSFWGFTCSTPCTLLPPRAFILFYKRQRRMRCPL